jgi:hypothetical protein
MALPHKRLRSAALATAALFGATILGAPLREARADDASIGKGIVGGSLAGAGLVTSVESLAGVHAGWAYGVGALVGAGGGGVGGYFIGNGSDDGKAPTYLLALGLAMVIPAIVLTLNGTRYIPEEGATEDRAPTAPAAEPGAPGGSVTGTPTDLGAPPPPASPAAPATPPQSKAAPAARPAGSTPALDSLVGVSDEGVRLGVPVPDVRPVFSAAEQRQYGMHAETELRMPVLELIF